MDIVPLPHFFLFIFTPLSFPSPPSTATWSDEPTVSPRPGRKLRRLRLHHDPPLAVRPCSPPHLLQPCAPCTSSPPRSHTRLAPRASPTILLVEKTVPGSGRSSRFPRYLTPFPHGLSCCRSCLGCLLHRRRAALGKGQHVPVVGAWHPGPRLPAHHVATTTDQLQPGWPHTPGPARRTPGRLKPLLSRPAPALIRGA
jgi:hypothetical protein